MRPLQSVQVDAYKQLHVLVRPAASPSEGSAECGSAPLEGTTEGEDKKNLACVPADATNDAVRLVRQRLRAYGVPVARDATEPYDYTLEVRLTGQAPRKPDPLRRGWSSAWPSRCAPTTPPTATSRGST